MIIFFDLCYLGYVEKHQKKHNVLDFVFAANNVMWAVPGPSRSQDNEILDSFCCDYLEVRLFLYVRIFYSAMLFCVLGLFKNLQRINTATSNFSA